MMSVAPDPYVRAILDKFDNVRASRPADGPLAAPPIKTRKTHSRSDRRRRSVLVNCFAGCDPGMVLYHKGLQFKDLYPPRSRDGPQ